MLGTKIDIDKVLANYGTKQTPLFFSYEVAQLIDGSLFFMSYDDLSPANQTKDDYINKARKMTPFKVAYE